MPICVKECQGNKRKKQAKIKGNEHIRGLKSRDFIFFKMGMLGRLIIWSNTCQVLMYINAFQGVPGHARDYRAFQHMLGECYDMLWHANMCLGILVMETCSRYKDVPRHVRCQGMLVCAKAC